MIELHLFNTVKQGQVSNAFVFLEWKLEEKGEHIHLNKMAYFQW